TKRQVTAVWQNGGFSAKLNGSSSIELLCKTEHLCFDFRHFAKLQTVTCKRKNDRANKTERTKKMCTFVTLNV
ncbi:MAG: hypothetical protein ACK46P_02545, partial [Flavobacteriia bacterium]